MGKSVPVLSGTPPDTLWTKGMWQPGGLLQAKEDTAISVFPGDQMDTGITLLQQGLLPVLSWLIQASWIVLVSGSLKVKNFVSSPSGL